MNLPRVDSSQKQSNVKVWHEIKFNFLLWWINLRCIYATFNESAHRPPHSIGPNVRVCVCVCVCFYPSLTICRCASISRSDDCHWLTHRLTNISNGDWQSYSTSFITVSSLRRRKECASQMYEPSPGYAAQRQSPVKQPANDPGGKGSGGHNAVKKGRDQSVMRGTQDGPVIHVAYRRIHPIWRFYRLLDTMI